MLSGTPALSRPAELFTQIRMIDWKIFPAKRQYEVRYCAGRMGRYGFEAKGQSNAEELKAVMDKIMIRSFNRTSPTFPFILIPNSPCRRLKKDVLDDLPEKRREIIYLSGDAIDTKMKQLVKAKQEELERTGRFSMVGGDGNSVVAL
jgi:SWI/SNF-related matrix-associated actin-dependent regulator of chromatin subfamily A-like protein 1